MPHSSIAASIEQSRVAIDVRSADERRAIRSATVVIPVLNEEATVANLCAEIDDVFARLDGWAHSVLFVDDGSTDGTWNAIAAMAGKSSGHVRGIRLRRNFGKSEALATGFLHCDADVVITMDGDLQDDPNEIPTLLAKIDEGHDLVSAWKQRRQDPLSKTLPSRLFNLATSRLTGVKLHDFNCGFKAYRAAVVQSLRLQGDMHRYIPAIAAHMGFSIAEVPVNHRPRLHGRSKFGAERYARGLLDLLTVLATTRYLKRPGHLFGGAGLLIGFIGMAVLLYLSVVWFLGLGALSNRPLLFFGILCVLLSAQLISLGLIAELLLRPPPLAPDRIQVKETLGLADPPSANPPDSHN